MKADWGSALAVIAGLLLVSLAGSAGAQAVAPGLSSSDAEPGPALPVYDHIVIVFEENKNYEQIVGNAWTPYISSVLCKEGAVLTKMFAEEHFSEGNYFYLLSGSDQSIAFLDGIPEHLLDAPNLAEQLLGKGLSFKGYSEDLPSTGSGVAFFPLPPARPLYARKHVPWVSFSNIPAASNVPFSEFPTDPANFSALPTVSMVIPNLLNDMHDGAPADSVPRGDRWLQDKLDAYYQWAKTHNSLLLLTFDENDDKARYSGLTNPAVTPGDGPDQEFRRDVQNRIPTILAGAHIKPGEYPEGKGITHVNLLRTLEKMYGLAKSGAQQPNALGFGIRDDYIVRDLFD